MTRQAGGLIDVGDFPDGSWVAMTLPTNYAQLSTFTVESKRVTDGVFIRGRIIRTATTTGTVTWATLGDLAHAPNRVVEIGGIFAPGTAAPVRAFVNSSTGQINTSSTTSGMDQLYFDFFYPLG